MCGSWDAYAATPGKEESNYAVHKQQDKNQIPNFIALKQSTKRKYAVGRD